MPTVSCAISLQDEQGLKISRFAVVVPTRIAKKSVDRNRIKRLIYEVLRLHKEYLTDGFDVLLFANAPIQNQKYEDVEPVVVDLLKKSKLLSSK
jgi:ribonuclease P protein component